MVAVGCVEGVCFFLTAIGVYAFLSVVGGSGNAVAFLVLLICCGYVGLNFCLA